MTQSDNKGGKVARFQSLLIEVRSRLLIITVVAISLLAIAYWGIFASDRYVSESHIVVQDSDLSSGQSVDIGGLLGGVGSSSKDQLMLSDYLLSVDMLQKLEEKLHLRKHYSQTEWDLFSRLWSADVSLEGFHSYYLSRVSVDYDGNSGILYVKAQAFTPEVAHAIGEMLVDEGQRHMNRMAHRLAQEQVRFLEKQVKAMHMKDAEARQAVLRFQNEYGLVSPQGTAENIVGIVNGLEAKLSELSTQKGAMLSYMMPGSARVVELEHQIAAVRKQIRHERRRLTAPGGKTLNATVEAFQQLQMDATFTQEVYKTALAALVKGRIDAARTLKMVSILQTPTMPQYALMPERMYNATVFILVTLLFAGIFQLMVVIIRDHRD